MRLFLALRLHDDQRRTIHEAASPLREAGLPMRWVDQEAYHLTLKFLGEVRGEVVPTISRAVARVASATRCFPLAIGGFGAFPTIRRPQVLWVGAEPSPALRCLKQDLEWALAEHGFDRETRAFHPHITLGRAEGGEGAGAFRGLDALAASLTFTQGMDADTLQLVRSQLSRQGPRYHVLEEYPLSTGSVSEDGD